MFCKNCGTELPDGSTICTNCETTLKSNDNPTYQIVEKIDNPSHAAGVVSCCFPVVGLILYFLWKDEKPNSSKLIGKWLIGGFIAWVVLIILYILLFVFIGILSASTL